MMFFDNSILKMIWGGRKQSLEGKINPGYKSKELHLEDKKWNTQSSKATLLKTEIVNRAR
jgi:hypothetical protein